jgi:hypothetical protein
MKRIGAEEEGVEGLRKVSNAPKTTLTLAHFVQ